MSEFTAQDALRLRDGRSLSDGGAWWRGGTTCRVSPGERWRGRCGEEVEKHAVRDAGRMLSAGGVSTARKYRNAQGHRWLPRDAGGRGRRTCVRIGTFHWRGLLARPRISVTAPLPSGVPPGQILAPWALDTCHLVVSSQPDCDCCRVCRWSPRRSGAGLRLCAGRLRHEWWPRCQR
jgi:hypothetical protein